MPDEMEARIAALELLFLELAADVPAQRLQVAMERIIAGDPGGEEQAVRCHAVGLLHDALRRHDAFTGGVFIAGAEN